MSDDQGVLFGDRDGKTFDPALDRARLNAQHKRVYRVMADEGWHTLAAVAAATGDPEASVSARLRDFRKARFGGHLVHRKRIRDTGLWVYRLTWNPDIPRPKETE